MKLIKSKVEYLPQEEGMNGIYKQIELCGRICYRSEDKITDTSAEKFVTRMISSNHTAMLEHGTVYLYTSDGAVDDEWLDFYARNPYSKIIPHTNDVGNFWAVTTNYRVLVENQRLVDIIPYLFNPTEQHERRYTFKFTCSRAIANELIRHRTFSYAQESQRYCGYDKSKFNGELTYIIPSHLKLEEGSFFVNDYHSELPPGELGTFLYSLLAAEDCYMSLRDGGWQAQQARDVLPNATKTELCITGFSSDWRHLLDLRLFQRTGVVHPDMLDLMQKLQKVMQENNVWDDIMKQKSKFE